MQVSEPYHSFAHITITDDPTHLLNVCSNEGGKSTFNILFLLFGHKVSSLLKYYWIRASEILLDQGTRIDF